MWWSRSRLWSGTMFFPSLHESAKMQTFAPLGGIPFDGEKKAIPRTSIINTLKMFLFFPRFNPELLLIRKKLIVLKIRKFNWKILEKIVIQFKSVQLRLLHSFEVLFTPMASSIKYGKAWLLILHFLIPFLISFKLSDNCCPCLDWNWIITNNH